MRPSPYALAILVVLVLLGSSGIAATAGSTRPGASLEVAATGSGKVRHVDPSKGDDAGDGSPERPLRTIQSALELAHPGDVVQLAPGTYEEAVRTVRDGRPDEPITVAGPPEAVVQGAGDRPRVVEVRHDHHQLRGFTVDGRFGDDRSAGYRDTLIHAQGTRERSGVRGLKVLDMTLTNALRECVRLRYFAVDNEIGGNTISDCGLGDFRFGGGGSNGEGVYVGTAPDDTGDGTNPTDDADRSSANSIHDNTITAGGECVSVKEGATANRIEANTCSGQLDAESGGIEIRGNANEVLGNAVSEGKGAGIRLEGAGRDDALDNDVVGNTLRNNRAGGIEFAAEPQGKVCGNDLADQTNPSFGRAAPEFSPTASCRGARAGGEGGDSLLEDPADDIETVISEDFSADAAAASFNVISGGTWRVTDGVYRLSDPGTKRKANGNVSVHHMALEGDYSLSAKALVDDFLPIVTDDFSVVFGYKNLKNYCYASFNETNDAKTSGIFLVLDGKVSQLADITVPILGDTWYDVGIDVAGASVEVSLAGATVAQAEATRCFGGPRKVGFGTRDDAARFDDLEVTRELPAPDPEGPAVFPGDILELADWRLELPTGPTKTTVDRIEQPELDTFSVDPWFTVDPTGGAVVLRAPVACTSDTKGPLCGSRTSSNTLYARSELREMTGGGSATASWPATEGTHTMEVELSFEALPYDKPHLVGAQIHGGSDDVTTIRLEGSTLWITRDDNTHFARITDDYTLGDRIKVKYVVEGGEIRISYQGEAQETLPWKGDTNYFKTGAYTQANCDNSTPCDGAVNYGEVHIYSLEVTHRE